MQCFHMQKQCKEKDICMTWVRKKGGDKGLEMGCCDKVALATERPKPQTGDMANLEAQARSGQTYRYLSSFEGTNRFGALPFSDEDFPECPPGLQFQRDAPKIPQRKKKKDAQKIIHFRETALLEKRNTKELNMVFKVQDQAAAKEHVPAKDLMQFGDDCEFIEATIDS